MKVLLFGFDGLRTDIINDETMSRLNGFLKNNVHFRNNRAVFPTETYVNHPCIFTGFLPDAHGLIANAFMDPSVSKDEYFLGSSVEKIEWFNSMTNGRLFRVPAVSEVLVKNGFTHFSISSNTPGSTRLMSHRAEDLGLINISVNGYRYAIPQSLRPIYGNGSGENKLELPDLKGLENINHIVKDIFNSHGIPDYSVIWYGEPDHSFHEFGIGAEESLLAIKKADECFGELLDLYWHDDVQVIVMSDHGHITVKKHFDLTKVLEEEGFQHSRDLSDKYADFTLLWGYSGNIYAHSTSVIPELVKALQRMPEIGMLFTADYDGVYGNVAGTFSNRLIAGEGSRSGDIRFILKNFKEKDIFGFDGTCVCPDFINLNSSIHGGLHNSEVNCLLGFGGNMFKDKTVLDTVSGVIDVTPTVYRLFDIKPDIKPHGRVLSEAFFNKASDPVKTEMRQYECSNSKFSQKIKIAYINHIPYFMEGGS